MNIGEMINELYELRSMRLDFEKQVEAMKQEEKALEAALTEQAQSLAVTSLKSNIASFSISTEVVPNVLDWESIYKFITEKEDFSLLQKRISVTSWRDYYTEESILVPGTQAFEKIKASLRKI